MHDIVLVHSNEKMAGLYEHRLKKHFRVRSAFDGISGVRLIKTHLPKMVITQYELPLLSGLGVLQFVRSHPPIAHIPVIFLSNQAYHEEALRLGANDWITVPQTSLTDVLAKILTHANN